VLRKSVSVITEVICIEKMYVSHHMITSLAYLLHTMSLTLKSFRSSSSNTHEISHIALNRPDDGGSRHLWTSTTRRYNPEDSQPPAYSPPWEPQILHKTFDPLLLLKHERNFCLTASTFVLLIFFSLSWMSLIYFIVSDNKFVVCSNFVIACNRKVKSAWM
jgi:hypothetical protein